MAQLVSGKVLSPIGDVCVLELIIKRLRRSSLLNRIVVATTDSSLDQPIVDFCINNNVDYIRGSEDDVLSRFVQASIKFPSSHYLRITADCPFVIPTS